MKSTSRIFTICMFCGKDEVSKEHIFGKAISRKIEPRPYAVKRFRHDVSPELLTKDELRQFWRRGGDNLLAVTSSSMCRDCNHLLGKELSPLSALITKIYKGETNTVPAKHTRSFLRYFQRIGMLVDLETAALDPRIMRQSEDDTEFNRNYHVSPPMLPFEVRSTFLTGEPSPDIAVYVGRHDGLHGRYCRMNVAFQRVGDGSHYVYTYKSVTFSIDKFTCLVGLGLAHNMNPKLKKVVTNGGDFLLDRRLTSTDLDVELNRSPVDMYPDDPVVPRGGFPFWYS